MEAIEGHDEREREIGFDQGSYSCLCNHPIPDSCVAGYQDGWDDNQADNWGGW